MARTVAIAALLLVLGGCSGATERRVGSPSLSTSAQDSPDEAGEGVAAPTPAGAVPEAERVLSWRSTVVLILFLALMASLTVKRLLPKSRRARD